MADQKNCTKGNIPCAGESGVTRCKPKCSNKLPQSSNEKLNKLVNLINKAKDTKAGKFVTGKTEDAIVNTAGTLGGLAGSGAGPVGAIVGDLLASTAVKHSILVKDSLDDLKNTEEFEAKGKWGKAKAVLERARANDQKAKAIGEGTGFLVGNSAAQALKTIPAISGIPLKGGAAALLVMPILQAQINKSLGVA